MGKRESYEPGTFCRVDLTTTEGKGAKAFYGDLFGWEFRDDEIPSGVYTRRHGDAVGAIDQQDEHPPHWNSYVSVTSAEETAARAKRLGARILEEPFDVAGFGRLAVLADPPARCSAFGSRSRTSARDGSTMLAVWAGTSFRPATPRRR